MWLQQATTPNKKPNPNPSPKPNAYEPELTAATQISLSDAFFTNLLGSKYLIYAETYRGV
jgi:hypothetical protein